LLLFRGRNDQESKISAAKSGLWLFFREFISEISEAYRPLGNGVRLTGWLKMEWVFATGYRRPRESGGPEAAPGSKKGTSAPLQALDFRFKATGYQHSYCPNSSCADLIRASTPCFGSSKGWMVGPSLAKT
jgi:hypothetical protein